MLNNRLPLIISNENCVLITEENHDGYTTNHTSWNTHFAYKFPHQFAEGKTFPEEVVFDNIAFFDKSGKEMLGCSFHAGFNTETVGMDQCVGFITYVHKSTTWKVFTNKKFTMFWFRDINGDLIKFKGDATDPRFVFVGSFKY